jgi:putative membrane protein
MGAAARALVAFVALEHGFFLVLEMFLFRRPLGRAIFRTSQAFADEAAPLAANQGLYNGFLAAGLVWGLLAADPGLALAVQTFFLACVVVAGIFGAITVSGRIAVIQALPALAALGLVRAAAGR